MVIVSKEKTSAICHNCEKGSDEIVKIYSSEITLTTQRIKLCQPCALELSNILRATDSMKAKA